jgi:Flp pilus assembly protein TadG
MLYRESRDRRRGVTALEAAVVYPVFLLFLIGLVVGALGVFRYQEVSSLAREGARFASVRGASYQLYTGKTAATPKDVYDNVIKPGAIALDPARLDYAVTWSPDNRQGSHVTVEVSYNWVPEAFFGGVDLTSKATMPISY